MPDSMFDAFTEFFDDIPDVVRHELCVLLVTLADEGSAERGADYEREARALFNARSQVGRFGDLINAVAVFDVYFAADAGKRFEPTGPRRNVIPGGNGSRDAAQSRYGDRLSAIATAQRRWRELRNTTLSSAAIGAALMSAPRPRPAHLNGHVNDKDLAQALRDAP